MFVSSPAGILQSIAALGGSNQTERVRNVRAAFVLDVPFIKESADTRTGILAETRKAGFHRDRAVLADVLQDVEINARELIRHMNTSFRPDSTTARKESTRGRGEDVAEKELTREEKIETLKVFAGMTEEQKNTFALGVMIGEYKAKYGAGSG